MPGKPHYTASQVIDAFRLTHGLVFLAAKSLGCTPETVQSYCKRYPAVQAAKEAARGELIDLAEAKLLQAVHRGEPWAVAMVLKTLGRSRGYQERHEITGQDGGPIQHAHLHLWEERLQAVHAAMAQKKAALMTQRALEVGRNGDDEHAADRS
jgi:hypothetical protein